MTDLSKVEIAVRMRNLPDAERNAAIDNSVNVIDLRPMLQDRRRNRDLAGAYRHAFSHKPPDGVA